MERPRMEIPKPVGCISRDLTMQEVLLITIRVTLCPNVLLQDLKEESCVSILYYQAIKVCKPVGGKRFNYLLCLYNCSSFQIYGVNTSYCVCNVNVIVFHWCRKIISLGVADTCTCIRAMASVNQLDKKFGVARATLATPFPTPMYMQDPKYARFTLFVFYHLEMIKVSNTMHIFQWILQLIELFFTMLVMRVL